MSDATPASPPLSRLHLADDDLTWVPLPVRAAGEFVAVIGFIVVVCFVLVLVALLYFVAHLIWYGAFFAGIIPVVYQFRDRVVRAVVRRRMQRQRRSAAYLPAASSNNNGSEGELVRVRGRIRAQSKIAALVDGRPVVFRRLAFCFYSVRAVHEAGTDFLLDDGSGEPVLIVIDGARLIGDDLDAKRFPPLDPSVLEKLEPLDKPAPLTDCFNDWRVDTQSRGRFSPATGSEQVLCDGDEVEVLGYRCLVVDQTVTARLERHTPFRAALRSSDAMPLLIAR